MFGFTAKQTLDYAQQLYEKKLLTYPRTDSQYLTEDMGQTAQHLVSDLLRLLPIAQGLALTADVGRVLNSKKVSDHHAIIPTAEFVKQGFAGLAESECKLMNLVCAKLLCAVAVPHEYETVAAVFSCAGNEFTAKGKTVLVPGWKEIDQRFRSTLKADGEEETEALNTLPELAEGQSFRVTSTVSEHFTSPPKAYTEDTLLSAMERAGAEDMPEEAERKGLGTPATRAAILEKLVQMGFVQRKGKQLVPTKDGINLAVVLPESLTSPALTAEWENRLTEIAKGNADPDEFMAEIEAQVRQLIKTYSCISADKQGNLYELDYQQHFQHIRDAALPVGSNRLIYESGMREIGLKEHLDSRPDEYFGEFVRYEMQPRDPELLQAAIRQEQRSREPARPSDFKEHLAALHAGLIKAEAQRIVAGMKRLAAPNSPDKNHFMVEVSPYFTKLASSRDTDQLLAMLPYKSLHLSSVKDRFGIYALVDKNENRDKNIRKPRASVRKQLSETKQAASPKKAAARSKQHEMEV